MIKTLYDKIWDQHVIHNFDNHTSLIYIDRHIVHEVTSPQAFEGLENADRKIRNPSSIIATADHNVPTNNQCQGIKEPQSRLQVKTLTNNCKKNHILYFPLGDIRQGIVHVIGPEQGFTLPGTTMVCGDSHTSTHGAFGALAFGIGTSEIEQVFATQTMIIQKAQNIRIWVDGTLSTGVTSKDLILYIISRIGIAGATGCVIEYAGPAIQNLSMESRMTLCNMSIEAGATAGLVAPDKTTYEYLHNRPMVPKGKLWDQAVNKWKNLYSDAGAYFDKNIKINASDIEPYVTWGTNPEMVAAVSDNIPNTELIVKSNGEPDIIMQDSIERALRYMNLKPGMSIEGIKLDKIFIGSCTNARIEDLRGAALIVKGKRIANNIKLAMVVPGSGLVKQEAEREGIDLIFKKAGWQWREPGCSMCLAMNSDRLEPGERCASTSNRNFEGRQGRGGRTHLMSPLMAAAASITGYITDVRSFIRDKI